MRTTLLIFMLTISFYSCEQTPLEKIAKEELPEDFLQFYNTFLQDSSFQMNHIEFPLEGIPGHISKADNLDNFTWKKEAWSLHKEFKSKTRDFNQKFAIKSDDAIMEYIVHNNKNLGLERRFTKTNNEWFLTFYSGFNKLNIK